MNRYTYACPVCGLESGNWTEPLDAITLSYDICERCGVEFGVDDKSKFEDERSAWATLRAAWERAGRPDWREERRRPDFPGGVGWLRDSGLSGSIPMDAEFFAMKRRS